MNQLIIGASIAIISAIIGAVIGPMIHILYENRREKQKVHNESLRNHFRDLETSAIKPMSEIMGAITNIEGNLYMRDINYKKPKYFWPTKDFQEGNFHIFKLHFPTVARTAIQCMKEVDNHNSNCESFIENLKKVIEEKTHISVRDSTELPSLFPTVLTCAKQTLYLLAKAKLTEEELTNLYHDFREARVDYLEGQGYWVLRTESINFGRFSSKGEADFAKDCLIKLQQCASLIKEMGAVYTEATRLEKETKGFSSLLDFTCQQYRELGQLLNEAKECPYCQVIFHPKNRSNS